MEERADTEDVRYVRGFRWEGEDAGELREVIEAAFDYRGNVTLELRSGESTKVYISNRDFSCDEPFVDVFPVDGSPRRRLPLGEVRAVVFSGKDPASGKSWETWVRKWKAKKEAESRGEDVGDIGLYPDSLD